MEGETATGAAAWSGQLWFWTAAALFWLRAVSGAFGVPRRLIRAAATEPAAARFALDLARYRLGRGRLLPLGLGPFRWPALGALVGYAIVRAALGETEALVVAAMLAPILAVDLILETRILGAVAEARDAAAEDPSSGAPPALGALVDRLGEALRLRRAATLVAVFLTVATLLAAS